MTQKITHADIQKAVLKIIINQNGRFSEYDIFESTLNLFEDVESQVIEKIVSKTLDYCKREIHLIDFVDGGFETNHDRKDVVCAFLNHEGISI